MGNDHDQRKIRLDRKKNRVGKHAGKAPANVCIDNPPSVRIQEDRADNFFNARDKPRVQARLLSV